MFVLVLEWLEIILILLFVLRTIKIYFLFFFQHLSSFCSLTFQNNIRITLNVLF